MRPVDSTRPRFQGTYTANWSERWTLAPLTVQPVPGVRCAALDRRNTSMAHTARLGQLGNQKSLQVLSKADKGRRVSIPIGVPKQFGIPRFI